MNAVFDASAVLAILLEERGAEIAVKRLQNGCINAVNLSEVLTKLVDLGQTPAAAHEAVSGLDLSVVDVTTSLGLAATGLRKPTVQAGLSLGDRLCLATALEQGMPAVTADRAWAALDVGVDVILIR